MVDQTSKFWDIFVITLIVAIAILIPTVTYFGCRTPVFGQYLNEGFESRNDNDLKNGDDDDDDVVDDNPEATKKLLKETMMQLDGKHAVLLKHALSGDMNPNNMKKLFKNNMMPDQVVEKLVERQMETFFNKVKNPTASLLKDGSSGGSDSISD